MGFVEDVVDGPQRLGPTSCPFLPPNVSRGMVPRCFHTFAPRGCDIATASAVHVPRLPSAQTPACARFRQFPLLLFTEIAVFEPFCVRGQ